MKNHQTRPTGSLALTEANVVNNNDNKNSGSKRGGGNPHGRGRGHGNYGHNRFPNRNYTHHRGGYNGRGRGRGRGGGRGRGVEVQIIGQKLVARLHIYVSFTKHLVKEKRRNSFPELGGVKKNQEKDVTWCEPSLLYLDPQTKQCETEVQKIVHLQEIANQLPDAFTDTKRVTKTHIPAANAQARVEIPNKQASDNIGQESQKHLKRGRPIGSKDKNPRKRNETEKNSGHDENVLNETQDIKTSPEEEMNDINK
ncbi:hypothetical protein Tco_0954756 [Tanacetum coccineum]|uniref:Uncharacterized protein n=1 Tax=Tanacetum coccineum TaxID=301880 RepID=A0ABQ5E5A7_9ASTR